MPSRSVASSSGQQALHNDLRVCASHSLAVAFEVPALPRQGCRNGLSERFFVRVLPVSPARNSRVSQAIVAFVAALIVILSVTGFVWAQSDIKLDVDGTSRSIDTQAQTVADVLEQESVVWDSNDIVTPSPNTVVKRGMHILVRHTTNVTLVTPTGSFAIAVAGRTVADALSAAGMPTADASGVRPSMGTRLREGMQIEMPDAFVRIISQTEESAPPIRVVKDRSLIKGRQRVLSSGAAGKTLRVYRATVVAGKQGPIVLVTERVISRPKARVLAVGTGRGSGVAVAAAPPRPKSTDGKRLRVEATGYSPRQPGLDFTTATGKRAGRGVVAVDPRVIPLGTKMYVPGYGYAVAADTGGAVKGKRIDLCFDTVAQALKWGRRNVTIVVLK